MAKRVLLVTRDLLFRSKLGGVVAAAGAEVSRDEAACDLAVLELGGPGATDRIGELVRRGIPVRSEEHTSELQSRSDLVCRLLLEKKIRHFSQRTVLILNNAPSA